MTCAQKKTWKLREATMIVALAWTVVFAPIVAWEAHAQKQPSGQGAEAMNMRLLGTHDLQARSAYQPVIQVQSGRWIAYIGHHGGSALNPLTGVQEPNGTSIVEVTDPRSPKYLAHIPGEKGEGEAGGAQMVRVCDGKTLPKGDPNKVYLLRSLGTSGHGIWDVTTPEKPFRSSLSLTSFGTRTRAGGSATPASHSWCRARLDGGRGV